MIDPHAQAMPLAPFLDFLLDESLAMDIEEVARMQNGWQPYAADKLPRAEGNLWLRFHIAPLASEARPNTFLLDMGQSVPGVPILYDPVHNELSGASEWRENIPAQRNIILLPEARAEAIPCYIRLEGLPGPWFAPMIRTPQNAASNWDSLARFGSLLALAVIMVLCVFRGLGEKGQWRYWTGLFVGVALAQGLLGMPVESQHMGIGNLAAILCPGLALMFLPHAGRHLMQARQHSRSIDIQLFLLSLPGAVLALAPLAPGWNWLDRWVDLWPLATLLFVPTALGAWIMRLPSSGRFLLACVLPPLFVAVGMVGLEFGLSANILSSAPLWGIALSALLLVTARNPQLSSLSPKPEKKKQKARTMPQLSLEPGEPIIDLQRPLSDPNLRIIPNNDAQENLSIDVDEIKPVAPQEPTPAPARMLTPVASAIMEGEARELAMRKPLDDILREGAALSLCSLPPAAREAAAAMTSAARRLASIISKDDILPEEAQPAGAPDQGIFNLQHVLRHAHDSVATSAECSGVALSWYMPPSLGQMYRGSPRTLETTLRMLLESSARATRKGAIKLSARPVPGNKDDGYILFTVNDDGGGYPPHERSSVALARAWELAGEYGGYLSVESSPEGTAIAFTVHLTPEMGANTELPHLLLASDNEGERWHLARILEELPAVVEEAQDAAAVTAIQTRQPTNILVAQGRMAVPAAGDLVRDFCHTARENGFDQCYALAITPNDHQWELLKASGFTHAMLEPVDPEVLRHTIALLLNPHSEAAGADRDMFMPEASALQPASSKTAQEAPTMLIEQEFGVRTNFEGPEWLGEEGPHVPHAKDQQEKIREESTPSQTSPVENTTSGSEDRTDDLTAPLEWAGEGKSPKENKAARGADSFEPLSMDERKPLVDFILAVEDAKTENMPPAPTPGAKPVPPAAADRATTESAPKQPVGREKPQEPQGATTSQSKGENGDPAIVAMLEHLEQSMQSARAYYAAGNGSGVAAATADMAALSERFGLRILTRMSQCVERAARANDMGALNDLLPELGNAVERTRILVMQKQAER